jgi:SAM-dependent methyltransferase
MFQHFELLMRWERSLALKAAIERAVLPGTRVLDAGCGSGLLSMWAARAGAARVVGIDTGDLSLARALVAANGCGERVELVQADLRALDGVAEPGSFDVLLALLYINDPRRDEAQSRLVADLAARYLAPGGALLPDRVVYRASPCDWPAQDLATRWAGFADQVRALEARYGLSFAPMLDELRAAPDATSFPRRRPSGALERADARLLADPTVFAEIDYRAGRVGYPRELELRCTRPGVLNTVVWTQELYCGATMIFSNESVSWLREPRQAATGDRVTCAIDDAWRRSNVLEAR